MLTNLTGLPDIADDLAQQTFLSAWQKLDTFAMGSFKSWLGSIAFRQFLMWKRSVKHNEQIELPETPNSCDMTDNKRDLVKALAMLPNNQREVLVLQSMVGLSQVEIAALLNLPLGTVKSHASRGLKQLQQFFRGE